MKKQEYIEIFNAIVNNQAVDINSKVLPLIGEYLEDIKIDSNKIKAMLGFLGANPILISQVLNHIVSHICKKYCIKSIIYKGQTILYYD